MTLFYPAPVSVGVLRPPGLAASLPVRVSLWPLPRCEGWQEWPAGCAPGNGQRKGQRRQEPGEEGEQLPFPCPVLSDPVPSIPVLSNSVIQFNFQFLMSNA